MQNRIKVGLYGIGLDTYWGQFEGLHDRLVGYQSEIAKKLEKFDVDVVNLGLVDNAAEARHSADLFQENKVRMIFLYVSTYALSSTVLPVVQNLNIPVVVLNLQPVKAIDYAKFNALGDRTKMTGEWLAHCQACSVPEIANAFLRAGIPFHQVTGTLHDDPIAWNEIEAWVRAAKTVDALRTCRVGLMGHYYNGMLDIYSDQTKLSAQLGPHFELIEMGELLQQKNSVTEPEIESKIQEIYDTFDVRSDCSDFEIRRAAITSVMLDKMVKHFNLGALAYFYNGFGDEDYIDLISSVIVGNSILTGKHIPVAGEYEIKNVLAMKILDLLDSGGSFTEFYAMDFNDDIVLMGHDGPGHTVIAEGKTKLKPLQVYHGKVGKGLSVEMSVRHGKVTLLSVIDAPDGNIRFLVAEGESVPGPILEIGNTNSRYRFSIGAREFVDQWSKHGPAHHCAIGVGHLYRQLEKIARILGIEIIHVC